MRVYKMAFTAVAGSNDAVSTIDIVEDGKIKAIYMCLGPSGMDALDDNLIAELSFSQTNTISINDSRQSLFQMIISQQFLTTGGGIGAQSANITDLQIDVRAGERIHLHTFADTGVGGRIVAYIYVLDKSGTATRRRRS